MLASARSNGELRFCTYFVFFPDLIAPALARQRRSARVIARDIFGSGWGSPLHLLALCVPCPHKNQYSGSGALVSMRGACALGLLNCSLRL